MRWKKVSNRGGDPAGSNPSTRKHSSDQYLMSPVAGLHAQLPVCVSPCASAKYASLRRSSSSARLRSVKSSTNATPSSRPPSNNAAPQDRHATAVFAEVFLLERLAEPGGSKLCQRLLVGRAPFVGRYLLPTHATRYEIFAAVLHHAEKGLVGLNNATFEIPYDDADDISLHQAPDLCFTFLELVVQTAVVERAGRLGSEHFQDGNPGGRKDIRGEVVFQIEQGHQRALFHEG